MRSLAILSFISAMGLMAGCSTDQPRPGADTGAGQPEMAAEENESVKSVAEVQKLFEQNKPSQPNFVPGEVIVKMKPGRELAPAVLGMEGVKRKTSGREIIYKLSGRREGMLQPSAEIDQTLTAVRELKARPDVEYAQPNWIKRIVTDPPDDTWYKRQWHYRNTEDVPGGINLPKMWDHTIGKDDIVAAVIDTGIFAEHADISGSPNLLMGYDMITEATIANDGDGRDADASDPGDAVKANECYPGSPEMSASWHGTHVAGTIGVVKTNNKKGVAGINWKVKVMPIRVLGKCGGTTTDINDAIRWAAGLEVPGVPKNQHPARVINLSLGTPPGVPCSGDPATQSAIRDAVVAGTTVVVAAGNDAVDASEVSPASCEDVITVAASDFRGHLVTRYSNFGETVEIMAPGGDVLRDDNNDGKPDGVYSTVKGGYAYYNGTSMAAPHVAGVAALLLAADQDLQLPAQVLARLQHGAVPRDSTQCPKPCGAGLLSAFSQSTGSDHVSVSSDGTRIVPVESSAPEGVSGSMGQAETEMADDSKAEFKAALETQKSIKNS